LHNLQITTSKNSKLRTTLQVRYRVTKPIAATYSLVGAGEQTMRDGVLTESELRAAWEAHIGNQAQELLTEYSWDRMPKPDRESIQAFLATTFSRRAAQMGLEIQQVNVLEFDYYQRKKQS
jgi:hypothetical protein